MLIPIKKKDFWIFAESVIIKKFISANIFGIKWKKVNRN